MVDHYAWRVVWSEEDQEWVGLCTEFPSLSHLAESKSEALAGIEALVSEVVLDMCAQGEPVPSPIASRTYSGKLSARVTPVVHRQLAMEAMEAGVSVNRIVTAKLAAPLMLAQAPVALCSSSLRDAATGRVVPKKRMKAANAEEQEYA